MNVTCDYVLFLQNPQQRVKYTDMISHLHEITLKMADPELRYQFEFAAPKNQPKLYIDEASTRCLGCHDDSGGVKNYGPANPVSPSTSAFDHSGMTKISLSHPVGLMYERRTLANSALKSSAEFPPNMVLVYGRLSCITCHDPLNPEGNHLVAKERGALCFACHNM